MPSNLKFDPKTRSLTGSISEWRLKSRSSIESYIIKEPLELLVICKDPIGKTSEVKIVLEAEPSAEFLI